MDRYGRDWSNGGLKTLFALMIINVAATVLVHGSLQSDLVLTPTALQDGQVYRFISSIFIQAGFMHLFFNVFALYVFGMLIAPVIGGNRFAALYLVSGIAGCLVWTASVMAVPSYYTPVLLGSSGAVMGIIMATAMVLPNVQMYILFIPFPMKLRTLAIVFIAIEVFNEMTSAGTSDIAYAAHIGGFLGGYVFSVLFLRRFIKWDPLSFITHTTPSSDAKVGDGGYYRPEPDDAGGAWKKDFGKSSGPVTQRELDYLLDKISRQGINSLSPEEMERLRRARAQMRGEE